MFELILILNKVRECCQKYKRGPKSFSELLCVPKKLNKANSINIFEIVTDLQKEKRIAQKKKRNREKRDKNETKNILENPVLAIAFFWQGSSKMYFSIMKTKSVFFNMNLLPSSNKESKAITLRSKDKDFSFRTSYGSGEFVLYCQRKRDVHE